MENGIAPVNERFLLTSDWWHQKTAISYIVFDLGSEIAEFYGLTNAEGKSVALNHKQQNAVELYTELMNEAKFRLRSFEHVFNYKGGPLIARDYLAIQLRMLCEVISLGCLVMHGDIKETDTRKLRKAYQADTIMKALETLHPRFYPLPITPTVQNGKLTKIRDAEIDYLKKEQLIALYRRCSRLLHRGTVDRLPNWREFAQDPCEDLFEQSQMLVNLLSFHSLVMKGDERAMVCNLRYGSLDDVQVIPLRAL